MRPSLSLYRDEAMIAPKGFALSFSQVSLKYQIVAQLTLLVKPNLAIIASSSTAQTCGGGSIP